MNAPAASLNVPAIVGDYDVLSAALSYADGGWYVAPTLSTDPKNPGSALGKRWQTSTSRDPEQLVAWFAGTDHRLVLHAGRSGAVMFDVDHPAAVPAVLAQAIAAAPFQTSRPDTPGRGHAVFAVPPGRRLGNSTGQLGKGWGEVRGVNGVIAVAPSVHADHAAGARYEWLRTGAVPVLPADIAALLPDAGDTTDAATDDQVAVFVAANTAAATPGAVKGPLARFEQLVAAGGSRHEALVEVACWAAREALAGRYAAGDAFEQLSAAFVAAATRGNGARSPRAAQREAAGVIAWAVGQAAALGVVAARERVTARNVTDPDDLVDPEFRQSPTGTRERLSRGTSSKSSQPSPDRGSEDFEDAPPKRWEREAQPLPRLKELPVDALGPLLGDVVEAIAEQFQVPTDLVVNLALPVITAAAGGSWIIHVRPGWDEVIALVTLTIAGSGERKSPALRALDRPLRDHEQALRSAARADAAVREIEREVAQAKVDGLRKQLAESLEDGAIRREYVDAVEQLTALPDDVTPRWLVDDATPEVLAKRLAEHGGLGVISAEPTLFGILLGRYSGGVPNVELYLKATSGDPFSVDRVGRDTIHVDHPCLSVGVCIQPGRLVGLGREDKNGTGSVLRDSGMLARFLFAYPGTLLGKRGRGRPMPADLADRWRMALVNLAEASRRHTVGKPETLSFALDADELLDEYAARLEPRLDPDTGDLAGMADWSAKLVGTCARIAGALTLLRNPDATVVDAATVADALRLGDAYISHAARALHVATVGTDSATEAAQVLTWLRENAGATFTRREVHQALKGRKWAAKADALEAPLAMLADYGHIRRADAEQTGPGRPPEAYELHPSNVNTKETDQ